MSNRETNHTKHPKGDLIYLKEQLQIIQDKATEDSLRKYASSLHAAPNPPHIKETLTKAVEARMKELTMPLPMAEHSDFD